jgi:phage terminase small subunit
MSDAVKEKLPREILTLQQKHFVREWIVNGNNATQAALTSGLADSPEAASVIGSNLLKRPVIQREMKRQYRYVYARYDITTDRILYELSCIAFLDIRDCLNDDGSLKPIAEIPEKARRALAGLDIEELFTRIGGERLLAGHLKKFKVHDKKGALELLAKYQGMIVEQHKHKVEGEVKLPMTVESVDLEDRIRQVISQELAAALE